MEKETKANLNNLYIRAIDKDGKYKYMKTLKTKIEEKINPQLYLMCNDCEHESLMDI